MERKQFIQWGSLAALSVWSNDLLSKGSLYQLSPMVQELTLPLWINSNDAQVETILKEMSATKIVFKRKLGYDAAALSSAFVTKSSAYYQNFSVIEKLEVLSSLFLSYQGNDGTVNIANLESPPDTAFLVELLSSVRHILEGQNNPRIIAITQKLDTFLKRTGEALLMGGVHTPNHRWVICSALAKLHALYKDPRYVKRVETWLSEGIYMDIDGHYPERSAGIYAVVENNSLITIARLLSKPELLQYVRKNLHMTWYYLESNGDIITTDSRRQDQFMEWKCYAYYLQYRYMAIVDNDPVFAAIANKIAALDGFEQSIMKRDYFYFLENEKLQFDMPLAGTLEMRYEKLLATSNLLRIRKDTLTATLFGGVDWPIEIASGRSNSPDFFTFRKGEAVLKSLRLSTAFFSMGYFYSDGIRKEGSRYHLHHKLASPYYQPLPKEKQNPSGDYTLEPSTDGRFWNKMQFKDRPVSNVKEEEISVTFEEHEGVVSLHFDVTGAPNVPITLELCFKEGGTFDGLRQISNENYTLDKEEVVYTYGADTIQFGPGRFEHDKIDGLEGERYSTHFGSLRFKGTHVYITGTTPFHHTIQFR